MTVPERREGRIRKAAAIETGAISNAKSMLIVSPYRPVLSLRELRYLAVVYPKLVWDSFGSWLRTIRPGIPPSEFVVANALRQTLPDFLIGSSESDSLAKFIADRQDKGNMRIFRLAS
jgi:hypothetical protein